MRQRGRGNTAEFACAATAAAFQAAHARFVAAAAKINSFLDVAQANLGDAAGIYVAADSAAAGSYPGF